MEDKPRDTKGKGATKGKDRHRPAAEGVYHPANNNEVPDESTEKGNNKVMMNTCVMVPASETDKVVKSVNNTKDVHSYDPNVASYQTTVECKEETETSSTTIKEALNKETLTVMKIGPLWTLFVNGKKLFLPEFKSAKTVTTEENYIIADKQVYEIKTGDDGHVFLEKFGTATVADRDSSSHASSSEGDNESKEHVRSGPEFNIKDNNSNSKSHRCEMHEWRVSEYEHDSKFKKSKATGASTRLRRVLPDKRTNNQVSSNGKKLIKLSDPIPSTNSILGIPPEESKSGRNEDRHQTINKNLDAKMQIQKENRDEKDTISEDVDGTLYEMFEKTLTLYSSERHSTVTVDADDPKQVTDKRLLRRLHTARQPAQKSYDFSRSSGTLNRTIMNEKNEFPIKTTGMPSTNDKEINEIRLKQRAKDGRNNNPETEDSTITSQHNCEVPALPPKSSRNSCATGNPNCEAALPPQRRRGIISRDMKQTETTPRVTGGAEDEHLSQSGDAEQKTLKVINQTEGARNIGTGRKLLLTPGKVTPDKTLSTEIPEPEAKARSETDNDATGGHSSSSEGEGPLGGNMQEVVIAVKFELKENGIDTAKTCSVRKQLDAISYMKWNFVLNNPMTMKDLKTNLKCINTISVGKDMVEINLGKLLKSPDVKNIADQIVSFLIKKSEHLVVNQFSVAGTEKEKVKQVFENSDMALEHSLTVYFIPNSDMVCAVYPLDRKVTAHRLIETSVKMISQEMKTQQQMSEKCGRTLKINAAYKGLFDDKKVTEMFRGCFRTVEMDYNINVSENVLIICLEGLEEDVNRTEHWITTEYVNKYVEGKYGFHSLTVESKLEDKPFSDIVDKYFKMLDRRKETFYYHFNDTTQSVSVIAKSGPVLDSIISKLRKLITNEIHTLTGCSSKSKVDIQVNMKDAKQPAEKPLVKITIVPGRLDGTPAEAVVNTTSKDLKLDTGAVSKSILKSAGNGLQKYISEHYPHGIQYGQVIETKPYLLLGCKYILHGCLERYSSSDGEKKLFEFVTCCLKKATELQCRSIAFPAIGTGNLGFPKYNVAATMFKAVKEFGADSCIKEVKFVIYYADTDTLLEFYKQEELLTSVKPSNYISQDVVFRNVRVRAELGSLMAGKYDTAIYIWEKQAMYNGNNSAVRHEPKVTDCKEHPFFPKRIVHVPCEDKDAHLIQAFRSGLQLADAHNSKCAAVYFNTQHPLLRHGDKLVTALIEAVKDMDQQLKSLSEVSFLLDGDNRSIFAKLSKFINGHNKSKPIASGQINQSRKLQIIGQEEDVSNAKSCLLKAFQLETESADAHTDGCCVVCNDRLTDPTKLDCGHLFCRGCITQQFQHTNICPTCGKECEIIAGEKSRQLMAESEFVGTVKLEKDTVSDVDTISSAGEVSGRLMAESEFVGNVKVERHTLASDDKSSTDGAPGQLMAESEFVGTIKLESKAVSNDDTSSSDDDDDDMPMDNFELVLKYVDKDGGQSLKILRAEIGSEALKWRYIFQNQDKRKEFEQKLKTFAATFEYKGVSPVTIEANIVMKPSKLSKNIKQLIQSETSGLHVEEVIANADEVEKVETIMSCASSALTSQSVLRFMQHPQGQTKVWFVGVGEDVSDVLNLFKQTQSFLSNITLSGATQIKRTK